MTKKWKKYDDMSSQELEGNIAQIAARLFLLNGLWILFVLIMLIYKFSIGLILLVITALKYRYDYLDKGFKRKYIEHEDMIDRKKREESSQGMDGEP
jgi:hypothetical protein